MLKKLIFAVICILGFSVNLSASPEIAVKDSPELTVEFCKRNKIYCAIVKLKPGIDSKFAMDLSNAIYKYSRRAKVDPFRVVAIAMQESSISPVVRYETVRVQKTICAREKVCVVRYVKEKRATDFGIYQFHAKTVESLGVDQKRLMSDLDYATKVHTEFLALKQKQCSAKYKKTAWACYNSSTPKLHKAYARKVEKHYNKIMFAAAH